MFAGRMIGASSSSFLNTQPISFSIHDLICANSMMMIYFNFLCFSISFLQKEEISNFFHYFFRMSLLIIAYNSMLSQNMFDEKKNSCDQLVFNL